MTPAIAEVVTKPKKPHRTSPTERTLAWLRRRNWASAITEHWNGHIKQRQDMWGFADVLAFHGPITALVQCTSADNMAARVHKIRDLWNFQKGVTHSGVPLVWTAEPHRRIYVVGWSKRGGAGERKLWASRWLDLRPDGTETEAIGELPPLDVARLVAPLPHDGMMLRAFPGDYAEATT